MKINLGNTNLVYLLGDFNGKNFFLENENINFKNIEAELNFYADPLAAK